MRQKGDQRVRIQRHTKKFHSESPTMPTAEEWKEKNGTCKGIRQRGHGEEKQQLNRFAHRLREERIPQSRLWSAILTIA